MDNAKVKILLFLILLGILLIACNEKDINVNVSLNQWQVPVLKHRENNPILQMKVVVNGDSPSRLVSSFTINTEGTDDLDDINAVRLSSGDNQI